MSVDATSTEVSSCSFSRDMLIERAIERSSEEVMTIISGIGKFRPLHLEFPFL